ncbi:MAG: pyridoxal 5'-phosphate synthase glutaminase subunit PdxT [Clostridia bacterium]|nr:pyridoxal 5'-phosphate synthase glutaminase subunit PdxT [Clostridia bacterium]
MKKIGVLALQGAFREHVEKIEELGYQAIEVRKSEDLEDIDGIILPGGESTAMGRLLSDFRMKAPLIEKIKSGMPVWGTCAGMILLAKELEDDATVHLGVMDIVVKRNAYGRQIASFEVDEVIERISDEAIPLVFIRAPYIVALGQEVELIHSVDGNIVAARQENMLVTAFHPELTDNKKCHAYFLKIVEDFACTQKKKSV